MTTSFADRLRSLRISTGMTLEGLAASSGVSIRAISDLERGRSARPHPRTLEALTKGMDLDEEERAWLWAALLDGAGRPDQGIPPARATSLVGRSEEIAKVARLLEADQPSIAVISGLPGVGKSALAVEASATVLPDSHRVFVDLADLDDSAEALFTILRTRSVSVSARFPGPPRQPWRVGCVGARTTRQSFISRTSAQKRSCA